VVPLEGRLFLAFDSAGICGARVSRVVGRLRLRAAGYAALVPGVLRPGALGPNLNDPQALASALAEVSARLESRAAASRACLVLPHGVARIQLLELPRRVQPDEFARFRLAPSLPYPPGEAVVGVLPVGRRRIVASAVRRQVVQEYEHAVGAAGISVESVYLAPLSALAGLLRAKRPDGVAVLLGDESLLLAAFAGGRLVVLRSRRREADADEARRLVLEVRRTARLAGATTVASLRVFGIGARELCVGLRAAGEACQPGPSVAAQVPERAAEWTWLGAAS